MNLKIKFRESFRPFAPSVLAEDAGRYFDIDGESPYMLMTVPVRAGQRVEVSQEAAALVGFERLRAVRSTLPSVTHVDGSARVQTVTDAANPRFAGLLRAFRERTGCGVLVNTSFNVRGEPIVCTPDEAYTCFMRTGIDALVVEDRLYLKEEQPPWREGEEWKAEVERD